ncbi:hypothetical protein ACRCOV_10615, partial [Streptococcus uberis]
LADYFLQNTAKELGVEAKVLHPDSEKILQRYYWSGNVRQLENVCRWLTVMAASQEILPQDLPDDLLEEHPQQNAVVKSSQADSMPTQSLSSQNPISAAQWFELLEEWTDNALIEGK